MRTTTLGEQGDRLPVAGFQVAFRPWRARDERIINEERNRNRAMTGAEFVASVLSHLVETWGSTPFDEKLSTPARLLTLGQSHAVDVLHAWLQLRRTVLGDELALEVACPLCRTALEHPVDLAEIKVRTPESPDDLTWTYPLLDGLPYMGEIRKALRLCTPRWYAYERLAGFGLNMGAIKIAAVAGCVVGIEGVDGDVVLTDSLLDDLTKRDLERLVAEVDGRQPGPMLGVDVACNKCHAISKHSISWLYDSFFSVSPSSRGPSASGG